MFLEDLNFVDRVIRSLFSFTHLLFTHLYLSFKTPVCRRVFCTAWWKSFIGNLPHHHIAGVEYLSYTSLKVHLIFCTFGLKKKNFFFFKCVVMTAHRFRPGHVCGLLLCSKTWWAAHVHRQHFRVSQAPKGRHHDFEACFWPNSHVSFTGNAIPVNQSMFPISHLRGSYIVNMLS